MDTPKQPVKLLMVNPIVDDTNEFLLLMEAQILARCLYNEVFPKA